MLAALAPCPLATESERAADPAPAVETPTHAAHASSSPGRMPLIPPEITTRTG